MPRTKISTDGHKLRVYEWDDRRVIIHSPSPEQPDKVVYLRADGSLAVYDMKKA